MNLKISIYCSLIFLLTVTIKLYSQDDVKNYKEPEVSEGSIIKLDGGFTYSDYQNEYNQLFNFYHRYSNVNVVLNASHWRLTPKLSFGIFADASAEYNYNKQVQDTIINDIT